MPSLQHRVTCVGAHHIQDTEGPSVLPSPELLGRISRFYCPSLPSRCIRSPGAPCRHRPRHDILACVGASFLHLPSPYCHIFTIAPLIMAEQGSVALGKGAWCVHGSARAAAPSAACPGPTASPTSQHAGTATTSVRFLLRRRCGQRAAQGHRRMALHAAVGCCPLMTAGCAVHPHAPRAHPKEHRPAPHVPPPTHNPCAAPRRPRCLKRWPPWTTPSRASPPCRRPGTCPTSPFSARAAATSSLGSPTGPWPGWAPGGRRGGGARRAQLDGEAGILTVVVGGGGIIQGMPPDPACPHQPRR